MDERLRKAREAQSEEEYRAAMGALIDWIQPKMISFVRTRIPTERGVGPHDLVQEILLSMIRSFRTFRGATIGEFAGFCFVIARRRIADHFDKLTREGMTTDLIEEIALVTSGRVGDYSPERTIQQKEALELLETLDEGCRRQIILHYLHGWTFGEIGETLGISEDSARMRTNRCIEKFRKKFRRDHGKF